MTYIPYSAPSEVGASRYFNLVTGDWTTDGAANPYDYKTAGQSGTGWGIDGVGNFSTAQSPLNGELHLATTTVTTYMAFSKTYDLEQDISTLSHIELVIEADFSGSTGPLGNDSNFLFGLYSNDGSGDYVYSTIRMNNRGTALKRSLNGTTDGSNLGVTAVDVTSFDQKWGIYGCPGESGWTLYNNTPGGAGIWKFGLAGTLTGQRWWRPGSTEMKVLFQLYAVAGTTLFDVVFKKAYLRYG